VARHRNYDNIIQHKDEVLLLRCTFCFNSCSPTWWTECTLQPNYVQSV